MTELKIGLGSCGYAAGARGVLNVLQEMGVSVKRTGCIGMCFAEPLVEVIDEQGSTFYAKVSKDSIKEIVESHVQGGVPLPELALAADELDFLHKQTRISLRNCGIIDPEDIGEYMERGGYQALAKVLASMTPDEVIEVIKTSGLRGRGGAGFPTWFKWNAAKQEKENPKYLICNADEGDPGAFMNRSLLESDPHTVLEGMLIAGFVIGSHEGIIYVRAEYPLAVKRLQIAIKQMRKAGLLGKDILGYGWDFDLRIKTGAGAFVCGEETALIASLEGQRGMPRLKPPFPAQKGYWQKPSNINNVETLGNVPWIILNGGEAYARLGTEKSKGTKVFSLAGKTKRGGLVEIPMGLTLRELIFDIGGGIKKDKAFKGVQLGGPTGGCIPERLLDTPIDYEAITALGAIMGSGGIIVMDEATCMVDMARYFLDFTQKESCGKCIHCRIGTKRMLEILDRITKGQGKESDIDLLIELGNTIRDSSLCALGSSAPNPTLSTIRYFRDEYEAHIKEKKCPAHRCKALINYSIDKTACTGCNLCAKKCPVNAISGKAKKPHSIDQSICTHCGDCTTVCRFNAVKVD
jgi:NADH-quinone oxidoreductase subunit F